MPGIADTQYFYSCSDANIFNPERGLYAVLPLECWPKSDYDSIRNLDGGTYSLCVSLLKLENFRDREISESRLQEVRDAFDRIREAGLKAIFRISYNDCCTNRESCPDATLAMMQTHLSQVRPILEEHSDVIAFIQAGMIGHFGEWHNSTNGLTEPDAAAVAMRQTLFDHMLANFPQNRFIQVRTPRYVREITDVLDVPLTSATAFQNTKRARIAHHNDCWLASITDVGTYPDGINAAERSDLVDEIATHTLYAPWGGETCTTDDFALAVCADAVDEARRLRATYLNGTFYQPLIDALSPCWENDFKRKLGYRIELVSATLPDATLNAGDAFNYTIKIRNVGWAPFYNKRPVFLRVLAGGTVVQNVPIATDPRHWTPVADTSGDGTHTLSGSAFAAVSVDAANLGFALWLPDDSPRLREDPDYSVQIASTAGGSPGGPSVWDAEAGHNVLKAADSEIDTLFRIDGDFGEWDHASTTATLVIDDTADTDVETDIRKIWVADDEDYIYLRIQTWNAIDLLQAPRTQIVFDTDNNSLTGTAFLGMGSEFFVENGGGFRDFNDSALQGLDFLRMPVGAVNDVELRVSRAAIYADTGNPVFPDGATAFRVGVNSVHATDSTMNEEVASDPRNYSMVNPMAPPVLDFISRSAGDGSVTLAASELSPNLFVDVYASSDLAAWDLLGRGLTDSQGLLSYLDRPVDQVDRRFYALHRILPAPRIFPACRTITIDGQFDDWLGSDNYWEGGRTWTDVPADAVGSSPDFTELEFHSDADHLYIRIKTANPFDWSTNIDGRIYIDVDNKVDGNEMVGYTWYGFNPVDGFGSDILIEAGNAYSQDPGPFNADLIASVNDGPSGPTRDYELSIPRTVLDCYGFQDPDNPKARRGCVRVLLHGDGTTVDLLPNAGGPGIAYLLR